MKIYLCIFTMIICSNAAGTVAGYGIAKWSEKRAEVSAIDQKRKEVEDYKTEQEHKFLEAYKRLKDLKPE